MIRPFIGLGLVGLLSANAAFASDDPVWDVDAKVGITSEYRDRGLRLSDSDFSAFGSVSVYHDDGFYGGVHAAIIDDTRGANTKTELYAGYSFDGGDYIYDLSVELEGFHGNGSDYYTEIKASIARDFGLAYIRGGLAYAPTGRWHTPDVDSYYGYMDLEVPIPLVTDLTLITHVGYDVRDGRSNLWDWSVGISAFVQENFEVTLSYEDSSLDGRFGEDAIIFGTKLYF